MNDIQNSIPLLIHLSLQPAWNQNDNTPFQCILNIRMNEFIDKVQDCSLTNLSALYLRIDQLFHYHRISGNQNTKDTIALACNVKNWLYV